MEEWDEDASEAVWLLSRTVRVEGRKCGCVRLTTPDHGDLVYSCAPCVAEARAWLHSLRNEDVDQMAFSNWGMY